MTFAYLHPPQNSHTMRNSDATKNALSVTPYNLRGLHEISIKPTDTEGDLGMDFPKGIVLTSYPVSFGGVLSQCRSIQPLSCMHEKYEIPNSSL